MAVVRYDVTTKLLLIGDASVGKTCLLLRFSNDTFSPTTMSTMGIDFKTKGMVVDGKNVKLQVCIYLSYFMVNLFLSVTCF